MNAACSGKWDLFDGVDIEDEAGNPVGEIFPHEAQAKAICETCPLLVQCGVENWGLVGVIVAGRTPKERM